MKIWRRRALLALLPLAACRAAPEGMVATAGGHRLSVAEAVQLLADEGYPNEPDVVHTVGDLWVDYVLLARAYADDPTLRHLDLSRLVEQQVEQELILAFRDLKIEPDTVIGDEEIARRFARIAPGSRVRARHIFLGFPATPTPTQRDSVRALARGFLERVHAGESFEQLARDHSQDPGTAPDGGDLGWFGPGDLFGALEDAAFGLQPGEVSDVVESVFGLHILRVDDREIPSLEDAESDVRTAILQERHAAAESALIGSVTDGANVQVVPGAADLVRRIAEDPGVRMSRRALSRDVVRYRGGSVDVQDLVAFMQSRAAQFRFQLHASDDAFIEENMLVGLAQRKLLVEHASREGLTVADDRREALAQELRERLLEAARELDLAPVAVRADETAEAARARRVEEVLQEMLRGTRDVIPLVSFSFVLRERYTGQVYSPGVDQVIGRVEQLRTPQGP